MAVSYTHLDVYKRQIYDRAGSSIAEASVDDFDFDKIMEGADWFHWSGITPAISANGAALTKAACICLLYTSIFSFGKSFQKLEMNSKADRRFPHEDW